jgi:predicted RNase H-like HicB family nuclease
MAQRPPFVVWEDAPGAWVAICPSIPGPCGAGDSAQEAEEDLADSIVFHADMAREDDESREVN